MSGTCAPSTSTWLHPEAGLTPYPLLARLKINRAAKLLETFDNSRLSLPQ